MAVTVQQIYNQICFDLLEDGGLVLGLLTNAQFFDILNLVLINFISQTGLHERIYTQKIVLGTAQYSVPDDIMRIDKAFLAGRWLPPSTATELNSRIRLWRTTQAAVQYWHTDEVPIKIIELAPIPNYNGTSFAPVYDTFTAAAQAPDQHRGLTIVGPRKPTAISALGNTIPLLADDWSLGYIGFGVLEQIFSSDSELKDEQRAAWAGAAYSEGINLGRAVTGELGDDQ